MPSTQDYSIIFDIPEVALVKWRNRKNNPVHLAWQQLREHYDGRDARGMRAWVFTLGWMACSRYYQSYFEKIGERLATRVTAELFLYRSEFDEGSGTKLIRDVESKCREGSD